MILVKNGTSRWQKAEAISFLNEGELQKLLYESPELIETEASGPIIFTREVALESSGYADLVGITSSGDILLIETKLARNPEIRRKVIGQIVEYAAHLWGLSFSDFDRIFRDREGKSIADLCADKFPEIQIDQTLSSIAKNLADERFLLMIAVDEMNQELEKVIAYLSSRGGGLKFEALAIRIYKQGETNVIAPQRYGQLTQPAPSSASSTSKLSASEILERSPDEHTRRLLGCSFALWSKYGHILDPGTAGMSFKAEINGSTRSIFWADPSPSFGISPLFAEAEKREAPPAVTDKFRADSSQIPGFPSARCISDPRPVVPFSKLDESSLEKFLAVANEAVIGWRAGKPFIPS